MGTNRKTTTPTQPRVASQRARRSASLALHPRLTATGSSVSGDLNTDVGTLAHVLVAMHAVILGTLDATYLRQRVIAAAEALVTSGNPATRRRIAAQAAGMAIVYLERLAPSGWTLLGAEYAVGPSSEAVDVAWRSTAGLVLYDEIKTVRVPRATRPSDWDEQATRYVAHGTATFGASFVACRVLPVPGDGLASAFFVDGSVRQIAPTPLHPLRAGQAVSR